MVMKLFMLCHTYGMRVKKVSGSRALTKTWPNKFGTDLADHKNKQSAVPILIYKTKVSRRNKVHIFYI